MNIGVAIRAAKKKSKSNEISRPVEGKVASSSFHQVLVETTIVSYLPDFGLVAYARVCRPRIKAPPGRDLLPSNQSRDLVFCTARQESRWGIALL